jgi:uncharacterized protein (TIGR03067 family)
VKAAPVKPAAKKDEDLIQGLWEAERVQVRGKQVPAAQVYKVLRMRFAGNTITTITEDGEGRSVFALDTTTSPKRIATHPEGKPKEKKDYAIYDLDGDTLKLCHNTDEGDAGPLPTRFRAGPNDKDELIVFKRVKEEKKEQVKKEEAKKPAEPAWKVEFRKAYGLADGQFVRRVAPPYPDCREAYFRDLFRSNKGGPGPISFDQWFTVIGWKNDFADPLGGPAVMPVKPEEGVALVRLLDMTLKFPPTRIESDLTTLERKATGDFVVRDGADPEKVAVQLEAVLRKELELPVRFSFRDAEEEVFVLSGKYAAKPVEDRKANAIEVYANHLTEQTTGGGGTGTLTELVAAVERHVNKPIVLGKVENQPGRVNWHYNVRSPMLRDPAKGIDTYRDDTNPAQVLGRLADQTGLTLTTEKRKVRVLVVEHAEVKK